METKFQELMALKRAAALPEPGPDVLWYQLTFETPQCANPLGSLHSTWLLAAPVVRPMVKSWIIRYA